MMKTNAAQPSLQPNRLWLGRVVCKRLMQCSTLVLVLLICVKSLDAQAPAGDPPAAAPPTSATAPPDSSPLDVPDFDIDLGTEEFENFGEEGFQVEEKLSPATETTVTIIKVAVVAVIVLLFGFIVMQLLRRKGAG